MRNLKKVIALVAVFAMLVSTVAFAQVFSDVASTDNYAEAIETLSALGIITGDDENNDGVMEFRPNDTITRAEVTAIVSRIQGMNNAAQTNTSFADVPSTHWASGYVAQAANQGIVNGYGDGNFGPEDNVKYQEMIKMLMETLGYRPFADDQGGYPTGYLTAAQRYGVLDDVVGGGIGVEASRGMVAQMVYNAIDTPLMDMVTYGKNGEYTVYESRDGYGFKTLLTRDLKMVKVSGKVVANSYTDTDTKTTDIDASASKTIKVKLDNSTNNYNYLGSYLYVNSGNNNNTVTRAMKFYQGEEDVDSLIGYAVDLYAKQDSNRNDDYTIVAITPNASKNNSIEFTLDQYEGYTQDANGKGTLSYLKNETDRNETKLTVQANPTVIYNGVAAVGTMSQYFGDSASSSIIKPDTNYSGKVTLLDTDDASGYDVVVIEVGVSAVVKEVTSRGQVKFMKRVTVPGILDNAADKATLGSVDFDEDDTNRITNLTKDGAAYDYTKLQKWDVITIVWNAYDDVYNMRVLGEDNYVDGTITSVPASSNGTQKYTLSDGNKYELAADAYTTTNLEAGVSGRFYIDEYGKLVAHDKDVEVDGAGEPVSGNYAYVLNTSVKEGTWGNTNDITVQILDKSGEIYEANLASTVKFVNLSDTLYFALGGSKDANNRRNSDSVTVKLENYASQADDIAAALKNQIITYAGNSSGDVKTVVLPGTKGDDNADLAYIATAADGRNASYDEETMIFKGAGVTINADTYVFYITNEDANVSYGGTVAADKDRSSVVNGAALVEDTYDIVAVDPDSNDEAGAVVILNRDGAISASSSVAVIDSVGKAMANGVDEVYVVDYYMNGELQSATTKVDMTGEDDIALAKRGDIFKLNVSGDTVTYAKKVLVFSRGDSEKAYAKNATAILNPTVAAAGNDEDYYFGAITKIGNNGNATLALVEDGAIDGETLETIKEGSANVYVYDPELRDAKALSVGGLGDAEVDDDLNKAGTVTGGDLTGTVNTPAYGMMDYAFARYYNNKPADIVVYKNYDFGRYSFTAATAATGE